MKIIENINKNATNQADKSDQPMGTAMGCRFKVSGLGFIQASAQFFFFVFVFQQFWVASHSSLIPITQIKGTANVIEIKQGLWRFCGLALHGLSLKITETYKKQKIGRKSMNIKENQRISMKINRTPSKEKKLVARTRFWQFLDRKFK